MAVRMQQEAERSRLRGSVVDILGWYQRKQSTYAPNAQADVTKLTEMAAKAREEAKNLHDWGCRKKRSVVKNKLSV